MTLERRNINCSFIFYGYCRKSSGSRLKIWFDFRCGVSLPHPRSTREPPQPGLPGISSPAGFRFSYQRPPHIIPTLASSLHKGSQFLRQLRPMSERGNFRGGRGSGRGGGSRGGGKAGGGGGGAQNAQTEKPKKENILDLGKYIDKEISVKFNGGREGQCAPRFRRTELTSTVTGTLKGYDQLMNLVLDDTKELMRSECRTHEIHG